MAGIFKKNDIRGVFGKNLTINIAFKIGYALSKLLGIGKIIVVAGDSRLSTPDIKNAISDGLVKGGCLVYDIGIGPSPMIYFTAFITPDIEAGVMVTASHNPPQDNGIKICNAKGIAYHYDNLYKQIENDISKIADIEHLQQQVGGQVYFREDLADAYYSYLSKQFDFETELKIAVEYGNGAAGRFSEVLNQLNCKITSIREEPDGNFPTLLPDPGKDNTFDELKIKMKAGNYDIGIAFDGDGDRVGFITPDGNIISPDKIMMIFAQELIDKLGSAKILIDVKISKATVDHITKKGGRVFLTQVGHSMVHENLITTKSDIAGELSCHYYFQDKYFGFDDGLYAALRLVQIISNIKKSGKDFQQIINELPHYPSTKEFREKIPSEKQDKILVKLAEFTTNSGGTIIDIDGIRGEFDNGWFIARKSTTEELLSYRVEGKTIKDRDELKNQILMIIKQT